MSVRVTMSFSGGPSIESSASRTGEATAALVSLLREGLGHDEGSAGATGGVCILNEMSVSPYEGE